VSLDSVTRKHEADPKKAQLLADARKNLALTLYADEPETLSALRLTAGLSQTQLAMLVETSQPHIARIEGGQNDPSTDLIARIAKALNVKEERAFRAIRNQLNTRRPTI
jgi:predicted transcriptional regulator